MFSLLLPTHANAINNGFHDIVSPHNEPAWTYWTVTDTEYLGITANGEPEEYITSIVATKSGEQLTVGYSKTTYAEVSGTINAEFAEIELLLNIQFGEEVTKSVYLTSAQLSEGERVTAYGQPRFMQYRVEQKEVRVDQAGRHTDTGRTTVGFVYKPTTPNIRFVYG